MNARTYPVTPRRALALPRWLDPNLLIVLLIATLAAWPLLTRPSLVTLTDAHQHALRVYELMQGWRSGVLYPRWAPDFYYGLGYPVFNYYAVLTYYLAGLYAIPFDVVAGIKFVLVLAAYLGPVGVYLFVRDEWNEWGAPAGLVAATVYAFAPYIVLVNPIMRGAAPEALATALAPLLFWTWTRLARPEGRAFWLPAVLTLAALLLAHNLMPFIYLALLGAWLAWEWLAGDRRIGWRAALRLSPRLITAGLVALGLTAFMWLPAALERGSVQYQNAFAAALDRRFVTWAELFTPMTRADLEPFGIADYVYRLGLPQWVLGALGALTGLRPSPPRRTVVFWLLVTAGCLAVMTPSATWLWEHVAPLRYLQFSFRLLGVTALALALLAAGIVGWAAERARGPVTLAAVSGMAVSLLFGLPLLNPLPWPPFPPITPQAILDFEVGGLWGVGTTWQGEFLPVTVRATPQPVPALQAAIAAGTVEKVDRAALPAGASVTLTEHAAQRDVFQTDAPGDFTLRVYTLAWDGWVAAVDGQRVPITPSDPEGYITVPVPAGAHTVRVELTDTPPRLAGWLISGVAGLAVIGGAVVTLRRVAASTRANSVTRMAITGRLALLVVGAGFVARYALDQGIEWTAANTLPDAPGAQVQADVVFDNHAALVAYDLPQLGARAGDRVPVTFYWLMRAHTEAPASVFVHLYGPDGQLWGQSDKPDPVIFFPTTRWPLGRVMTDAHQVALKPETPPGTYRLAVGLWDRASGVRSHPLGADGQPLPDEVYTLTDQFTVAP